LKIAVAQQSQRILPFSVSFLRVQSLLMKLVEVVQAQEEGQLAGQNVSPRGMG